VRCFKVGGVKWTPKEKELYKECHSTMYAAIEMFKAGNTSAASIPLALTDAVTDRRIKRGNLILLEAMGGGFTWGSALLRW